MAQPAHLERSANPEAVLVLAPTGQDARLIARVLEKEGMRCQIFSSMGEVVARLRQDAGILILAEEALDPAATRELKAVLVAQEPWSDIPMVVMTTGGETTFASMRVLREFDRCGNVTLLERPFRPITLVSVAQVALRSRRRQLEVRSLLEQQREATRVRDEFISIASHELKTPITSLKLHTQINKRVIGRAGGGDPPAWMDRFEKYVNISAQQLDRLARLVEDMLDVSRISSGRLLLNKTDVDLSELLREVTERLSPQVAAAGCSLTVSSEPGLWGHWDRYRVEQVIINLLTNATRYGAGRPVSVLARKEGGAAHLEVRDQGLGIAPEDQARIFERFERAPQSRNIDGLGLGLYICREIVVGHGGTIAVHSRVGRGAAFTVRLPLRG
jgi:signal transduction histidine kinase